MAFQADCPDFNVGEWPILIMYSLQGGGTASFSLVDCTWGQGKEGQTSGRAELGSVQHIQA